MFSDYLNEALAQFRIIIDDCDECDYTYSDTRLVKMILTSACIVLPNLSDDEYTIDLTASTISPDPDKELTTLLILKAACLLSRGEAKANAACNVKIIDGPSTIDTGRVYKSIKEMSDSFCADYENAKANYKLKNSTGYSSITPTSNGGCYGNKFTC